MKMEKWHHCVKACRQDEKCKSWSFKIAGCKGDAGLCHFKTIPRPRWVPENCYISGHFALRVREQTPQPTPQKIKCPTLSFATTSPLPSTVIGGDYNHKINASGGVPPFTFCPVRASPGGDSPRRSGGDGCDNSAMPAGLRLHPDGLISGQVQPNARVGYQLLRIAVQDSCPNGPQKILKDFYIDIKQQP